MLHYIAGKRLERRPAHGRRRHQRAARGPQAAGRAGQGATTCWPWRSCSTCPTEVCAGAQRGAARPRLRRPRAAQPAQPAAPVDEGPAARGLPPGARPARRRRGRRGRRSSASGCGPTGATTTGPFDIIGDVHGCHDELAELLGHARLRGGSRRHRRRTTPTAGGRSSSATSSTAARRRPAVLRLVMGMVAAGDALCVPGNHEAKLLRALRGRNVTIGHGLAETLAQLAAEPPEFSAEVADVHRRPGQPLRARRRPAGRRPRRPAERHAGPGVGRGAQLRPLRRHHRRDRRVRPARPLPVGRRLPGRGHGRLRPHAGARGRVGQPHDLHRHRLRVRRQAHRAALARARAGLGRRRPAPTASRPARWPAGGATAPTATPRPGRTDLDLDDVSASASSRRASPAPSPSARRTPPPRWR